MAEDLLRHRQVRAHQEGRPIDRVEAHDVLADQMEAGRPEFVPKFAAIRVSETGNVIRQSIDPDIHHVVFTARNLDAPVKTGPADGQILEAAFHERDHLVTAACRFQETGFVQ